MGKKSLNTPRSQIRHALRLLFMKSRERQATVKRDKNTCQHCGKKGSVAKGKEVRIECHHINNIQWEKILDYIQRHLLVDPKDMICLCHDCHEKETERMKDEWKIL